MKKKRVFSGTRATGKLHLGNYLGAIEGYLKLQNNPKYECIYMVVDLHAITTPFDVNLLAKYSKDVVLDFLACGLDPDKSIITVQSMVPEHAYLMHLLSTEVTVARMLHLPTYKDKVKQHPKNVTMALLNYPVLMAADILAYKADLVPVGIDQEPHLEIAREIARKLNDKYGTSFPEPKRFSTKGGYIPSLTGEGKMSKSIEGSFINLDDSLDEIKNKLAKVPTDLGKGKIEKEGKETIYVADNGTKSGGVGVLMVLAEMFLGNAKREVYEGLYKGGDIKYSEVKNELAEAIYSKLKPIQEKRKEIEKDGPYLESVIERGAEKARVIAGETLKEVKEKMGLI